MMLFIIIMLKQMMQIMKKNKNMKLKTLVKHLIMQWPGFFPNALAVYEHLFYVIGNGSS